MTQGKAVGLTDERLNRGGMQIIKRDAMKMHQLTKNTFILSAGMYADYQKFWQVMDDSLTNYEQNHGTTLSSTSIASLVSRVLYGKRFFPFYSFNVVAGFDDSDEPAIWGYDAIGSYGRAIYQVTGSGKEFFLPFLDQQVYL